MTGLRDKMEAGRFIPVIDRRYPLAEITDAYRYVQTGEKAGVVVIDIVPEGRPAEPGEERSGGGSLAAHEPPAPRSPLTRRPFGGPKEPYEGRTH